MATSGRSRGASTRYAESARGTGDPTAKHDRPPLPFPPRTSKARVDSYKTALRACNHGGVLFWFGGARPQPQLRLSGSTLVRTVARMRSTLAWSNVHASRAADSDFNTHRLRAPLLVGKGAPSRRIAGAGCATRPITSQPAAAWEKTDDSLGADVSPRRSVPTSGSPDSPLLTPASATCELA